MMMTLLFLREDAGHFSKGSEGERERPGRAPERGGRRNEKLESEGKEEDDVEEEEEEEKMTTTTRFPPRASAEANVRNDS